MKTPTLLTAVLAALSIAPAAFAQSDADSAFLMRAGVGRSSFAGASDTGFQIAAGYQFSESFSAELYYNGLGKYAEPGANLDASALGLAVTGYLPFGDSMRQGAYGFARLGLGRISIDAKLSGFSQSASANRVGYGLGLGYAFSRAFSVVGAYDYVNPSGGSFGLLSVGIEARF